MNSGFLCQDLKILNFANSNNSFFDVFSVCLKTIDQLDLKLLLSCRHTASFRF